MERLCSWPSWISARARSHSRLGLEGHKGHLITNALARPFLHLLISTRRPRRENQQVPQQAFLEPTPPRHPIPRRPSTYTNRRTARVGRSSSLAHVWSEPEPQE